MLTFIDPSYEERILSRLWARRFLLLVEGQMGIFPKLERRIVVVKVPRRIERFLLVRVRSRDTVGEAWIRGESGGG